MVLVVELVLVVACLLVSLVVGNNRQKFCDLTLKRSSKLGIDMDIVMSA